MDGDLVAAYEEIIDQKKTTFKEVVTSASIGGSLEALIKLYPDQCEMIDNYAGVLEFLLNATPAENEDYMYLLIEEGFDECQWCEERIKKGVEVCTTCTQDKGEKYYNVSGWKDDGTNTHYGIEYTPWEEWLSMYVSDDVLSKFTKEEIVAHAMWEMTFVSFDPEKIKEAIQHLQDMAKEIDEAIASGDMSKFKSWDELKAELDLDDLEEEE